MKTYYSLLNISKTASSDEVKSAYRALASRYHPDINSDSDSAEIFKLLNRAYTILSDSDKRHDYDDLIAGGAIYRSHHADEVVESSGAFQAYSNTLANILFFAFLAVAATSFFQWMAEINNIFWNRTTFEAILYGGLFGLAIGFNSNFSAKEIFNNKFSYYKLAFWLVVLASIALLSYLIYKIIISFIWY